jgi:hypothetical protein
MHSIEDRKQKVVEIGLREFMLVLKALLDIPILDTLIKTIRITLNMKSQQRSRYMDAFRRPA